MSDPTPLFLEIPPEVLQMGRIHLEGNVTPHSWYDHIRFENGKVDLVSVTLLSEIVYWYRPTYVRDEISGKVIATHKKFKGDALQKSKKSLADQFGLTERQVKDSLARLEQLGLITRDYRSMKTKTGLTLSNVLFIEIHPKKIEAISFTQRQPYDVSTSDPHTPERHTYTEITTKTTKRKKEEAAPLYLSFRSGMNECMDKSQSKSGLDKNPIGVGLELSNEAGLGLYFAGQDSNKSSKIYDFDNKKQHKVNYPTTTLEINSNYPHQKIINSNKKSKKIIKKEIDEQGDGAVVDQSHSLASFVYQKLQVIHPTIKKPNLTSWQKQLDKLLKRTCEQEVKEVLDYIQACHDNPKANKFWATNIQSANSLDNNFSKILAEMKNTNINPEKENEKLAAKVWDKCKNRTENDVRLYAKAIEFINGPSSAYLKFDQKDFREQVRLELKKRNIELRS